MGVNDHYGDDFSIETYTESCCTPKTHATLYVIYTPTLKKRQKEGN